MQQTAENKYGVRQLASDLWTIEEMGVRCFLLHGPKGTTLIDSCASGGIEFYDVVRSIVGDTPISVMLTHADPDHIAGIPQESVPTLHPAEFDRYRSWRPMSSDDGDRLIAVREGYIIPCGERELEVLLISGHTPGSIALLDTGNRCIFSGDTISTSHVYMFGNGRNLEAYIDSLAWIESISEQFDKFYCSHGDAEVPVEHLAVQKEAAKKLLAGELKGAATTFDVGEGVKLYKYKSTAFLY
jgi:glyoxylase-like metal-dependent hydrolase (beta-lactamase superfamily II)